MKRLTLLAAALVMVLGFAVNASAAPEVTISGNILVNAVWGANWDFADGNNDPAGETQAFWIRERFNLGFTAVANENLKGVIILRSTRQDFGQGGFVVGSGGASGGGGGDTIGVNQAYIDFNWPGTSVNIKAGFQPVPLPAAVGGGSMIHDDIATAVMASTEITDGVSFMGAWVRLADAVNDATGASFDIFGAVAANGDDGKQESNIDAVILALPLAYEGFSAGPFFVYAPLGQNAAAAALNNQIFGLVSGNAGRAANGRLDDAWWAGSSFELSMLDPFILKADINYGTVNADDEAMEREGWLFDVALEYTGFDFMNLEGVFAYTTGYDNSDDTDGRMPVISDSWALGSFWFGGGLITGDDIGNTDRNMGFWALALSATGIQSFAEGLTHDAHIVYAQGTNEDWQDGAAVPNNTNIRYGRSLLEDDSMLELDFNTMYKVYDELTLYNGIGYINLDADGGANTSDWAAGNDGGDAWKFQIGAVYQF